MKTRSVFAVTLAAMAVSVMSMQVRAGGDKIAFPENFAQGAMYTTLDRADNKQYRELFVTPAAIEAAKKGEPLPSGTVITMEDHRDGKLFRYIVMEKRTGWGAGYPPDKRNGEWEFQAFTADRKVNEKANLTGCFQCHKPLPSSQDFVFSYDKMKSAAK